MAYRDKKRGGNDKYLRLTGLWQSKNNEEMWSGKLKAEQVADLLDRVKEAQDADAPMIFFLWVNTKGKGKRDPEFQLQCCVGDSEESPRSRRESRNAREEEEEERPRRKSQREEPEEEPEEEQVEEEEEPKRKSTRKGREETSTKSSKRDSSW